MEYNCSKFVENMNEYQKKKEKEKYASNKSS